MANVVQQAWDKWFRWIQLIKKDVQRTVNDNAVFGEFRRLAADNGTWITQHHGGYFVDFVRRSYISRAALGVRRHVKNRKPKDPKKKPQSREVSFLRLLDELYELAPRVTYEPFYVGQFQPVDPDDEVSWQEVTFGELSDDGKTLSQNLIAKDIAKLEKLTKTIETFADREIAHLDPRGFTGRFTYAELDDTIETFNELVCKYVRLLTGDGYMTLQATIQFDWTEVFHHPLVKPVRGRVARKAG